MRFYNIEYLPDGRIVSSKASTSLFETHGNRIVDQFHTCFDSELSRTPGEPRTICVQPFHDEPCILVWRQSDALTALGLYYVNEKLTAAALFLYGAGSESSSAILEMETILSGEFKDRGYDPLARLRSIRERPAVVVAPLRRSITVKQWEEIPAFSACIAAVHFQRARAFLKKGAGRPRSASKSCELPEPPSKANRRRGGPHPSGNPHETEGIVFHRAILYETGGVDELRLSRSAAEHALSRADFLAGIRDVFAQQLPKIPGRLAGFSVPLGSEALQCRLEWRQADPLSAVGLIRLRARPAAIALFTYRHEPTPHHRLAVQFKQLVRDSINLNIKGFDPADLLQATSARPALIIRPFRDVLLEFQWAVLLQMCTCAAVVHFERAEAFLREHGADWQPPAWKPFPGFVDAQLIHWPDSTTDWELQS